MTVQELIDTLQSIEDKTREIRVLPAYVAAYSSSQVIEAVRDTISGIMLFSED